MGSSYSRTSTLTAGMRVETRTSYVYMQKPKIHRRKYQRINIISRDVLPWTQRINNVQGPAS